MSGTARKTRLILIASLIEAVLSAGAVGAALTMHAHGNFNLGAAQALLWLFGVLAGLQAVFVLAHAVAHWFAD